MTPPAAGFGTRIVSTGSFVPEKVITNFDLAEIMDQFYNGGYSQPM